ncbi:hypothetical protein AADZ84_14245 [Colwelliaceae bacterium MEBiC 14330]
MAKNIMRSIRPDNFLTALLKRLPLKALLLTFTSTIFLSACGIKGELYQTPVQPGVEEKANSKDSEAKQQATTVESNKAVNEFVGASQVLSEKVLETVKSNNNVS